MTTPRTPTEVRRQLLRGGFTPLPVHGKAPVIAAWQKLHDTTEHEIEFWSRTLPAAQNTGILTRLTPTLDIDILDPDAAAVVERLVRDRFEEKGDVLVRFGRPPKRAIPFRTLAPFPKIVANFAVPDGASGEKLEMLYDGQQVVVDGIHPNTHQPYIWFDRVLGEIKHDDLPLIDAEVARTLVDHAARLLVEKFDYRLKPEKPSMRGNDGKTPSHMWRSKDYDFPCTPTGMEHRDDADGRIYAWVRTRDGAEHIVPKDELVPTPGGNGEGQADWGITPDVLIDHDKLAAYAMCLLNSGMSPGAAVNFLRAQVAGLTNVDEQRRARRLKEIPGMVDSAAEKLKPPPTPETPALRELAEVHALFRQWLGEDYDLDVLNAVLATAASERLCGDPLWLLIISGSGNAKTETVQALAGAGAPVTSTIASEGALLSATPRRDKSKQATGGLLRAMGDHGVLVIKDVTSILSADRNTRACVLAALREIYDGRWERNVGTDGGRTLTWTGRIAIVGAVTTPWDAAHTVVAAMGDRFVLIRSDSRAARANCATRAIHNAGGETAMREALAQAVGGLIGAASKDLYQFSDAEIGRLVKAADIVTMARTAVERDYRGEVVDAHDPEMPTRFAKQLAQLVRGAVAIGVSVREAMRLAIRCARDSIPPLRREILLDIAANPNSRPRDVHRRLARPRSTVRKELEALYMLRLLKCDETDEEHAGQMRTVLHYSLATDFDRDTLLAMTGVVRKRE
jgi:hypothetical protein